MSSLIPKNNNDPMNAPQFKEGLERHVWPSSDGNGIVTKESSDNIFGPKGLGLSGGVWATLLSFLARTGITKQTGSKAGETNVEACVKGWGQGACSSRVLNVTLGVDEIQLERLIKHLQGIALELKVPNNRITDKVLAVFISTQELEPYSTSDGISRATTISEKFAARFRGHIQWQGFDTLCGQIDSDGVKQCSPELIRDFFNSEQPFFKRIVDRRRELREGTLTPGEGNGVLAHCPKYIDRRSTDLEYKKNKSGLWLLLKIARYMIIPKRSKLGPLLER